MINEVDEVLRSLVKAEVVQGADVEVLFDAPTREWASRRNTPTLDLYLYDIREDTRRRATGHVDRYIKLAYLITAWTQRPEDEHRLLSSVLACFMRYEIAPSTVMTPLLAEQEIPIGLQIAYPPPEDRQVSDVWTSLGGDLKPSVDLVVTVPMVPDSLYEIAEAVMKPLRLRSFSQVTVEGEDPERHLPDSDRSLA